MKYKGKTEQEWNTFYDGLTVDDTIVDLLTRLFPTARYRFALGIPSYDSLQMVNKPVKSVFEDELPDLIADKKAEIAAIFVEINRRAAFIARFDALKHGGKAILDISGEANLELVKEKLIKNNDLAALSAIEAEDLVIDQRVVLESSYQLLIKAENYGKDLLRRAVIEIIKPKRLSDADDHQLEADTNKVFSSLSRGSFKRAKQHIDELTNGNITQADKDKVKGWIDDFGG